MSSSLATSEQRDGYKARHNFRFMWWRAKFSAWWVLLKYGMWSLGVLTTVLIKIQVLWDVTHPVYWCVVFRRFGEKHRLPDRLIDPDVDAACIPEIFEIFTSGHIVLYQKTWTFVWDYSVIFRRNFLRVLVVLFYIIPRFVVFRHWATNPIEKFKKNLKKNWVIKFKNL